MDDSQVNMKMDGEQEAGSASELRVAAMETYVLARLLVKSAKRDLERRLELCGVAVGALAYRVMRLLDGETSTLAELSRVLGIGAAALVPVVDALEAKGFVKRGRDPKDRRRTPLTLTPAGREVLAQVPAVDEDDSLVKGLGALGVEGSRQLLNLLRELVTNVLGDDAAVSELAARLAPPGEFSPPPTAQPEGL
jgi:DNA-binding MarR family transcriptional regulator